MTEAVTAHYRAIFATGRRTEVIAAGDELMALVQKFDTSAVVFPPELAKLNGNFRPAWDAFIADRKERKQPVTSRAAQMILKKLAEHPDRACMALGECIERGWRSFKWEYFDRDRPVGGRTEPKGLGATYGVGG